MKLRVTAPSLMTDRYAFVVQMSAHDTTMRVNVALTRSWAVATGSDFAGRAPLNLLGGIQEIAGRVDIPVDTGIGDLDDDHFVPVVAADAPRSAIAP